MPHAIPPALVRGRTEFLVDNLRGFLEFGESRIDLALEEQRKEIESLDQALLDTYGDDLWTDADVEILQERWGCDDPDWPDVPFSPFHDVFPRYLRYSFITLAALVFESELLVLCGYIAADRSVNPPESGGKASMAKNARAFLLSQLGPGAIENPNWDRLQDMLKVRNCIAHAGGRIDLSSDRDYLAVVANRNIGVGLDDRERPGVRLLRIERKYCGAIVEDIASFFALVCDAAGY